MTDAFDIRQETFVLNQHDVRVSIYELFRCLSNAMDLVHPGLVDHHKRTAFIAGAMADEMGLPSQEQKDVLLAGLVHDAGAFSLREKLEVARFDSEAVLPHCLAGYLLLQDSPSLRGIAAIVRHHHVHWARSRCMQSAETTAPKASHLLHLADRVAISLREASDPLVLGSEIVKQIRQESGRMLNPELVQVFEKVASRNVFWFDVTSLRLDQALDWLWRCSGDSCETISLSEIERLFSRIIDFRSRFTAAHSMGVATIAENLGERMGLAESTCRLLCTAGHHHDLGKLSVPAEILEKPSALTPEEISLVRIHPYHTFQVLRTVEQLHDVSMWNSYHHERLDGSGYPFHLKGDDLNTEARILAVADVF
jgi:HD-GYP domain-containing protein (c-di-GMP phosphodiesterase class II)